jgi:uncharacterized 2Fe-2S/4Fe-4S cluster protein (DUF4445 family)
MKPNVCTGICVSCEFLKNGEGCRKNSFVLDMYEKFSDFEPRDGYGVAVDIGTTTIAMELFDLQRGERLAAFSCLNSQRKFGADVISRLTAAMELGAEPLTNCLMNDISNGVDDLVERGQSRLDTGRVVVSGNTVMLHFLQGLDISALGTYPFTPASVALARKDNMVILPCVSAFVGADLMAGVLFCESMSEGDFLLVDLGTNGEIALSCGGKLYVTAASAGPAFEGGFFGYASEAVEAVAELLRSGELDTTGLLSKETDVSQESIREVQLAKAAVRVGIDVLLEEAGLTYDNIDRVYLAGGFGYKVDVRAAAEIGLIPAPLAGKVQAVGNSSLGGCAKVLLNPSLEEEISRLARHAVEINLALHPKFNDSFIKNLDFGGIENDV